MKVKYGGSGEDKEDEGGRGEEEKCLRASFSLSGRKREPVSCGRGLGLYMKLVAQLCLQTLWAIGACGLARVHGRKCECSCACMQVHLWSVCYMIVFPLDSHVHVYMYMHCVYTPMACAFPEYIWYLLQCVLMVCEIVCIRTYVVLCVWLYI